MKKPIEEMPEPAMKAKPKERNIAEASGLFFAVVNLVPEAKGIYKNDIDRMRNGENTETRKMMVDNLIRSGFTKQETDKFINVLIAKVETVFDKMEKGIEIMEMTGQQLDIGLKRPLTIAEKAVLIMHILDEPITGKNAPVDAIRLAKEGYLDKGNIMPLKYFAYAYKNMTEELGKLVKAGKVNEKILDKFNETCVTEGVPAGIKFLKTVEKGKYKEIANNGEKRAGLESKNSVFAELPDINILAMRPEKTENEMRILTGVERKWMQGDKTESMLKERTADMEKTAKIVEVARLDALAKYNSENA